MSGLSRRHAGVKGLQLIAAAEEENYLLATAAWYERYSPFKGLV